MSFPDERDVIFRRIGARVDLIAAGTAALDRLEPEIVSSDLLQPHKQRVDRGWPRYKSDNKRL